MTASGPGGSKICTPECLGFSLCILKFKFLVLSPLPGGNSVIPGLEVARESWGPGTMITTAAAVRRDYFRGDLRSQKQTAVTEMARWGWGRESQNGSAR